MANYAVTVKTLRGYQNAMSGDVNCIDMKVANYLGSIDSAKTIRAFTAVPIGVDECLVIIVHDS